MKTASTRWYGWLLLILLTAVFLRLHDITNTPPGLTHDEADHGITAWEVVNGARSIYFTVGHGREPLYDYSTAVLMSFLGPTYLAGRLTAVFFSLILIAGMAAWTHRAFDDPTALLTAAGLAVGFWPVMTARHALRSVTLPALFVLAVYFFWRGPWIADCGLWIAEKIRNPQSTIRNILVAAVFLGATFYTYIPARILWAIFPALLGYLALWQRPLFRRAWRGTVLLLLGAAVIALPLFYYLYTHPTAELRLKELSGPLTAVTEGDFEPLMTNTLASLRLFTVEGDTAWRYNIPGRPFLQPVMGVLFYLGVGVALVMTASRRRFGYAQRKPPAVATISPAASFFALAWLVAGMSPVFVTGPELSVTQAMGMQPVLYLFPALGLTALGRLGIGELVLSGVEGLGIGDWGLGVFGRRSVAGGLLLLLIPLLIFTATAVTTARDYFMVWANDPAVRVQYETTMVTAMRYLNGNGAGPVAVSTTTPGRFHSPAVAQMTLRNESVSLRWFNAGYSLLLPQDGRSQVITSGFAPLAPELAGYFETAVLEESLPLPETDLDRPLDIYRVDGPALLAEWQRQFESDLGETAVPVNFGDVAEFLGYDLQTPTVRPGQQVRVATLWRVQRPLDDIVLFTHVLGPEGEPIAQADRLDAPSHAWHPGDVFIQLHQFEMPAATAVGQYPITTGLYTPANNQRFPIIINGTPTNDSLYFASLTVTQ